MKRIFLFSIVFLTIGCSSIAPFRTGNIVVHKFDTTGYKTTNPVAVHDRVVNVIVKDLDAEIKKQIKENSKLIVSESCTEGGYELKGRIDIIRFLPRRSFWGGITEMEFGLDVEVWLFLCGATSPLLHFFEDEDDIDMIDLTRDLSESIVEKIRQDPSLSPKTSSK